MKLQAEHLVTNAVSLLTHMLTVPMKPATCFSFNVMNAKKSMKAAAVRNARILFIFLLKSKRKKEKGLIREGIFLISQERD